MSGRSLSVDIDPEPSRGFDPEANQTPPNLEQLLAEARALANTIGEHHASDHASGGRPSDLGKTGYSGEPGKPGEPGPGLADLVGRYWRLVADEELAGRTAQQMLTATLEHLELARQRLAGELKLTVSRSGEHTVALIVTDDMPFLVDSVTAAITAAGLELDLLVHPQVVVRREALGALSDVLAQVEPDAVTSGDLVESWMRVEVALLHDDTALTALRNRIQSVLTDVREAVEDWSRMRTKALTLADELSTSVLPVPEKDMTDSVELLRWLADDHFTFLGYREYRLTTSPRGETLLDAVMGTGLGILRRDPTASRAVSTMSPEAYGRVMEKRLLIITKANSRSTVHRSSYLDYVGVKVFDANGTVIGERRFLGLFGSTAYLTSVRELPVIKRKVTEVVTRSGLSPRSHSGKDLLTILEDYPREELFQISTDDLFHAVMGVLRLAGRRQVRLFARKDQYGRFISCLVYLPRDRYTTVNRLRIQSILLDELNGIGVDYTTRVSDATLARIHFIVRTDPHAPPGEIDADALSAQIADATRLWDEDFRLTLEHKLGEENARTLVERYGAALPETYKDSHTAHEAVQDLAMLELVDDPDQLVLHLFRRRKNDDDVRFKIFRIGEAMALSDVLPLLHSLGVRVIDERPYEVRRTDGTVHIYDFGLALPAGSIDLTTGRAKVENAFSAAWRGESEVDSFNELVLRAGLTWRQVVVLRAYAKYLRQAGTVYSQDYMESTFVAYPEIAALLVSLFDTRFDPGVTLPAEQRQRRSAEIVETIGRHLDAVTSLDQDRILRSFLTLITATVRTSFFQRPTGVRPKSYVAFKLDPQAIPDLPAPRPRHEIFVYSPLFEGVHLRFGAVARGGIRWSDRREDFRTEVLGLVKAQTVKNTVIVPVGAKGGFVLKSGVTDREALQAEGVQRYREFMCALLDVTDNLVGGSVVPPRDVVRHDGDDPYLVVAADKGTATFSDIANAISLDYGFWLGDAFASGGSAGYDHKKIAITARGAWESVKRHFVEMDADAQTQDFTVVGIGDMSGDVFGNAMLRSPHINLVAAFDHRHIFVDPTPDAATSFSERARLFALPRSTWQDYNPELISPGGGIWPRASKSVPVSAQMREALGIADPEVTAISPAELVRTILQAPVDLLWNGGIGTYVKASAETHADVGDKNNDGVRINGAQIRAKVVGEGGNLGLTQRGRVEYATEGGTVVDGVRHAHICTDFIDNSAGVDCSDHEVNIKILLGGAVADGELTDEQRDALLVEMTDEVADLVLRDNYDQACALGISRSQSHPLLPVHRRMINEMESTGRLNRDLEALPTDLELEARASAGGGLTSPELAVLLAYTKIIAEHEINESELPDDGWTAQVLRDYFPAPLRDRYADRMPGHRLRREIVTMAVVNEAVNRGGISFLFRAMEETGASMADVIRAYVIARDVFGLPELWRAVQALDNKVPVSAQTAVYLEIRRLMDRAVRWIVGSRRSPIDVVTETARLRPGIATLLPTLSHLFRGRERDALGLHAERLRERGIPSDIAAWATRVMYGFGLLDIVDTAQSTGRELQEVAGIYFLLSERFRVDDLLSRISALPRHDRWQTLARMALRYDLYAALAALTVEVLAFPQEPPDSGSPQRGGAEERVSQWELANAPSIARAHNAIGELDDSPADLAALSVLLRQIRTLHTSGT